MIVFRPLHAIACFFFTLGLCQPLCFGAQKDEGRKDIEKSSKAPASTERQTAFLGVIVDELHPAILSHLPELVSGEQGVLVRAVSADSPAVKGGIKAHDVLTTYDDQKLFSPEQVIKLVRSDKPGREVALGLIRKGHAQVVKVKLGERLAVAAEQHPEEFTQQKTSRFAVPWLHGWGQPGKSSSESGPPNWNSFDSMTLKKLDKDRFHASIKHTDKQGKLQTHEFEGTRDEIRKKIEADEDLTPDERTHLLRSLNLGGPRIPLWIFPDDPDFDF